MGSDIYRYTVISIVGNVIVVRYESAQGSSLAPTDPQESSFAFWVCALAELDTGAFEWNDEMKRVAACALAAHNTWRDPTGDIIVKKNGGEPLTMDSIKEMMGEKLAGSYGTSGGQRGTTGSIGFRSVGTDCLKNLVSAETIREQIVTCKKMRRRSLMIGTAKNTTTESSTRTSKMLLTVRNG
eukprot:m.126104 g.126104  ORF g.126104 m.126104 type:complete len:183 (+) comp17353_c0_seq1:175-723(+)